MLPLLLVLISASSPLRFSTDGASPSGRTRFEISEGRAGSTLLHLHAGARVRIVEEGRNAEAAFVAHENLLVVSSCGSPCELGHLYSPGGQVLATLWAPVVSPSNATALGVEPKDLQSGDSEVMRFDLSTGRALGPPQLVRGLFLCHDVRLTAEAAIYTRCEGGPDITISFQPRRGALSGRR